MLYSLSKFLIICFCKIFFRIEVKGKEVFPQNQPFILASNHISNLDPLVVGSSCPRKLAYLAKEELFKNRLLRFWMNNVGGVPLKRGKTDIEAVRTSMKTLKNRPLLIFPQGRRSDNFDNVNAGVGFLHKKTGVPVIAARVYGTDRILPKWAKFFRPGKIKVVFAKVDNIDASDSYEDITQKVVNKIKTL
jgi:1-acyl-sn-glycerol-3-phosphate acyltransferase